MKISTQSTPVENGDYNAPRTVTKQQSKATRLDFRSTLGPPREGTAGHVSDLSGEERGHIFRTAAGNRATKKPTQRQHN